MKFKYPRGLPWKRCKVIQQNKMKNNRLRKWNWARPASRRRNVCKYVEVEKETKDLNQDYPLYMGLWRWLRGESVTPKTRQSENEFRGLVYYTVNRIKNSLFKKVAPIACNLQVRRAWMGIHRWVTQAPIPKKAYFPIRANHHHIGHERSSSTAASFCRTLDVYASQGGRNKLEIWQTPRRPPEWKHVSFASLIYIIKQWML